MSYDDVVNAVDCSDEGGRCSNQSASAVKFLGETKQPTISSLFMIPSQIQDGSAPRIMAHILSHSFPVLLDSGAEVSVPVSYTHLTLPTNREV